MSGTLTDHPILARSEAQKTWKEEEKKGQIPTAEQQGPMSSSPLDLTRSSYDILTITTQALFPPMDYPPST